jgi:hypothetical protein
MAKKKNIKKKFTAQPPVENPVITSLNRTEFNNRAVPTPVDHDGIKFMNSSQVAPLFGVRSDWNAKHTAYDRPIPHYKEVTNSNDLRSGRVYFSMGEVVRHLESSLGKEPHLKPSYDKLKALHEDAISQRDAAHPNGDYPNLHNQEHPANKNFASFLHHLPQGRPFTTDDPTFSTEQRSEVSETTSNLDNPRAHGKMVPVTPDLGSEQRSRNLAEFNSSLGRKPYTPPVPKDTK